MKVDCKSVGDRTMPATHDCVNDSVKYLRKITPHPALFLSVLAVVGAFRTDRPAYAARPGSIERQSADAPKQRATPLAKVLPPLPLCPPGPMAAHHSQPKPGHHRVILAWNASVASPTRGSKAVGYCVYRRKRKKKVKDAATLNPPCSKCEEVNSVPVVGTSCVDDVVEDGATYDYAVTAINANGILSIPSNAATAVIPEGQVSSVPGISPQPPSCRAASNAK